jgi:hypothetical protein
MSYPLYSGNSRVMPPFSVSDVSYPGCDLAESLH